MAVLGRAERTTTSAVSAHAATTCRLIIICMTSSIVLRSSTCSVIRLFAFAGHLM